MMDRGRAGFRYPGRNRRLFLWVDSGRKAVREVRAAMDSGQPYDIAMVDWIMPDMDGVETTRQIRKITGRIQLSLLFPPTIGAVLKRKHAGQAPITYIQALCLKLRFIMPFLIWAALRKSAVKKIKQDAAVDFDGRHVLLVEDNGLNLEIAKSLLEMYGLTVDSAENERKPLNSI